MARTDILLILVDDLGWTDLTCYGSAFYETPNLDALARQGLLFTDAYASCPVCSPTRASIMSGKYPARVGVTPPERRAEEQSDAIANWNVEWATHPSPRDVTVIGVCNARGRHRELGRLSTRGVGGGRTTRATWPVSAGCSTARPLSRWWSSATSTNGSGPRADRHASSPRYIVRSCRI